MLVDIYQYVTDIPRWHMLAMLVSGYVVYYFKEVVKQPYLAVRADSVFKQYLLKKVPSIETKYWPTWWCVESRAQTIFASILRSTALPQIRYHREILTLKDGGEVALDWLEDNCQPEAPLILVLPGLTGESQAEYIKCLVMAANKAGIRMVVFNYRGLGIPLKTPRLYCAANTEDICEVISYVRSKNTGVKIGACGISMGGLILGNYMAKHSEEARLTLTAAKIISSPWNVFKGCSSIEQPYLNNMLGRHLAERLCRVVGTYDILKGDGFNWDMDKVMQSRTIKEFDSNFTVKSFGYKDVDHYYTDASLHDKIHHIKVPLLCLSAADDPFQPLDALPLLDIETSSHVAMIVTARGGHIGFLEGCWPRHEDQYMTRIFVEFFSTTLFDPNNEFEAIAKRMAAE